MMKKIRLILFILAATWTIITCKPTEQVDLIISNTNVIDVIQGKTITGQDVIINGDKIQSIKPHEESPLKSKSLINGEGKYLIPGFWDMHVHTGDADIFFPLNVANGITGVRDMGSGRGLVLNSATHYSVTVVAIAWDDLTSVVLEIE